MITTDVRTAVSLAVAAQYPEANARAPVTGPRSPSDALSRTPLVSGKPASSLKVPARAAAQATKKTIGAARSSSAGYAAAKTSSTPASKSSSKAPASDPLAFLKDRGLSIEEKLIRLLGYLNGKWEKQMEDKMKQIAASEEGKAKAPPASSGSGSSAAKKGGGGVLGSLGGIGKVIQAVISPASAALELPVVRDVLKQVGGPVLAAGAAALGFPALAPLALKYGPQLVDAAASLASSVEHGTTSSASASAQPGEGAARASSTKAGSSSAKASPGSSSSGGTTTAASDAEKQMVMMEIQRLQQKQQEMFGLVSNILKSSHDLRMSLVNNIR